MPSSSQFDGFVLDVFPPRENGLTPTAINIGGVRLRRLYGSAVCCSSRRTRFGTPFCRNEPDKGAFDTHMSSPMLEVPNGRAEFANRDYLFELRITCSKCTFSATIFMRLSPIGRAFWSFYRGIARDKDSLAERGGFENPTEGKPGKKK